MSDNVIRRPEYVQQTLVCRDWLHQVVRLRWMESGIHLF